MPKAFDEAERAKIISALQTAGLTRFERSGLRAARIDNEPVGDDTFWAAAVQHEMLARGEKAVKEGTSGAVRYQAYASDDLKPRYYLVGVSVRGEDLFVIEGFFPNQESYERHIETVVASLATFRPE